MKYHDPNTGLTVYLEDAVANLECVRGEVKGNPIYSYKGTMFTGIVKQSIFLRLSEPDREKLYDKFERTAPLGFKNQKRTDDLVVLPENFYDDPENFIKWLIKSYDYTKSLPVAEAEEEPSRFKDLKAPITIYLICGLIFWAISTANVYPILETGHENVMLDYQRCAALDYIGYALNQDHLECTQFHKTNPYTIVNGVKIYSAPVIGFNVTTPFAKSTGYYGHITYWESFSVKNEFINYAIRSMWMIPGWPFSIIT